MRVKGRSPLPSSSPNHHQTPPFPLSRQKDHASIQRSEPVPAGVPGPPPTPSSTPLLSAAQPLGALHAGPQLVRRGHHRAVRGHHRAGRSRGLSRQPGLRTMPHCWPAPPPGGGGRSVSIFNSDRPDGQTTIGAMGGGGKTPENTQGGKDAQMQRNEKN